jgi:hypothetical protein
MGIPAAFPIATPSLLTVVAARLWLQSLFWKLLMKLVVSRIILDLGHFPATIVILMMVLLGSILALSHGPVAVINLMPTLLRMILVTIHSTVIMVTLVVILAKTLVA